MAIFAARVFAVARELAPVDILMAPAALCGRNLEVDVFHAHFQVGRLMAIDTGNRPMRACKLKGRGSMVKPQLLRPGTCRVARFATPRRPIRARGFHALSKLARMRIDVASGAREVAKPE